MAKAKAKIDPEMLAAVMAAMAAVTETGGKVEGATQKLKAQGERTQAEQPEPIVQFDEDSGLYTITCQLSDWIGTATEKGNVSVCSDKTRVKFGSHRFDVRFSVLRKADEADEPYDD